MVLKPSMLDCLGDVDVAVDMPHINVQVEIYMDIILWFEILDGPFVYFSNRKLWMVHVQLHSSLKM